MGEPLLAREATVCEVTCPPIRKEPPSSGRSFHDHYSLSCKLGQGHYATVYAAQRQAGKPVAVKIMDLRSQNARAWKHNALDTKRWQAAVKEVAMLRRAHGQERVAQFVDVYYEGGLAYIIMEKCDVPLMDMLERIPALTEASLMCVLREMLRSLACIHAVGIVHRDVKPDNFLCMGTSDIKLCDFGVACLLNPSEGETGLKGVCGTPAFMAPEMLKGKRYDEKVDVWSFGVIAYVLLLGCLPFEPAAQTQDAMKAAILSSSAAPPSFQPSRALLHQQASVGASRPTAPSEDATGALKRLLAHSPSKRPYAEAALALSYFQATSNQRNMGSLRPMLQAARQIPAFHMPSSADHARVTDVDVRVCCLQGYPDGQTLPRLKMKNAWSVPEKGSDDQRASSKASAHQASGPPGLWSQELGAKKLLHVPTADDAFRGRANGTASTNASRAPSKESRLPSKESRRPSKESAQERRNPSKSSQQGSRRPSNASSVTMNV